jgi:hypothetical protein
LWPGGRPPDPRQAHRSSEPRTSRGFIKHAKYFELLLGVIDSAEEILGARSVLTVSAYLLGYEFAMVRAKHVELGLDPLVTILEEIVRPDGTSFLAWAVALIRQCGSDEAAFAHFRELIAREAERERNEE